MGNCPIFLSQILLISSNKVFVCLIQHVSYIVPDVFQQLGARQLQDSISPDTFEHRILRKFCSRLRFAYTDIVILFHGA